MQYRALFIGGPLDGQERVTQNDVDHIYVAKPRPFRVRPVRADEPIIGDTLEKVEYRLLFAFGRHSLVYSIYDTTETLNLLWRHYSEIRQGS